ncbi:MAG TPA: hypothetical protein VFK30_01295 [Anaerolineae bacterium]|nr:hypothetical protein [Anaerolineae bacterium]
MIQRRSISWGSLLGGLGLLLLGLTVLIDQTDHFLPEVVQRYWAVLLIAAGVWNLIARLRLKEDAWAGLDYGTGLYVIRHRRQGRSGLWAVIVLLVLGAFLLWASMTPDSNVTAGPLLVIALGVIFILRSLL